MYLIIYIHTHYILFDVCVTSSWLFWISFSKYWCINTLKVSAFYSFEYLEVKSLDPVVILFFFDQLPYCFPQWLHHLKFPQQYTRVPVCQHHYQRCSFFILITAMVIEYGLIMVLMQCNDVQSLLMFLLASHNVFGKMYAFFVYFKNYVSCFLY